MSPTGRTPRPPRLLQLRLPSNEDLERYRKALPSQDARELERMRLEAAHARDLPMLREIGERVHAQLQRGGSLLEGTDFSPLELRGLAGTIDGIRLEPIRHEVELHEIDLAPGRWPHHWPYYRRILVLLAVLRGARA